MQRRRFFPSGLSNGHTKTRRRRWLPLAIHLNIGVAGFTVWVFMGLTV